MANRGVAMAPPSHHSHTGGPRQGPLCGPRGPRLAPLPEVSQLLWAANITVTTMPLPKALSQRFSCSTGRREGGLHLCLKLRGPGSEWLGGAHVVTQLVSGKAGPGLPPWRQGQTPRVCRALSHQRP